MNNEKKEYMMGQIKKYLDGLRDDDDSLEEYYNTPKGYAMAEFTRFLVFLEIPLPDWVIEYYKT